MAEWSEIGSALQSSAKDRTSWRIEAASWLLAESGAGVSHWPELLDKAGLVEWNGQDAEGYDLAFVDWEGLARRLAQPPEKLANLYGTNAEWAMLRFACSLVTGKGGDWGADLTSLDHFNQRIILGALAWAAGGISAAYPYMDLDEPAAS